MSETITHESTDDKLPIESERIISAMEQEALVLKHFGVTAVSAASSPLENQIYHIADLQEPTYND